MICEIHSCINPEWAVIKAADPYDNYDFIDMMEQAFPNSLRIVHHNGYENAIAFKLTEGF